MYFFVLFFFLKKKKEREREVSYFCSSPDKILVYPSFYNLDEEKS